jgi:hypothetical protein
LYLDDSKGICNTSRKHTAKIPSPNKRGKEEEEEEEEEESSYSAKEAQG